MNGASDIQKDEGMAERIVVAGAGIVGVSTALWLQRAGHHVVLVDRQGPASGTSHGNAGVLAAAAITPVTMPGLLKKAPFMLLDKTSPLFVKFSYLPRLLPFLSSYLKYCNERDVRRYAEGMAPLIHDTVSQHRALAEGSCAEAFIEDSDYCFGYSSEAEFQADQFGWNLRREWGFETEIQSGDDYAAEDPIYDGCFHKVVRCKGHGRITDPGAYVKALASHFVSQGGELLTATVLDVYISSSGRAELITDSGIIGGDKVVMTTGVWSKPFLEKFGLSVPLETERGYHIELVNPALYPKNSMMVVGGKFAVTPMRGRIRCAGVVEFAGLTAEKRHQPLEMLKTRIRDLFKSLDYDHQIDWLGHRPALVDSLPMLGPVDDTGQIFTAFGHQHLGLTGGAKTGRLMAGLISEKQPHIDMYPYTPRRF